MSKIIIAVMKCFFFHFLFLDRYAKIKRRNIQVSGSKNTFNILEMTKNTRIYIFLIAMEESFDEIVAKVV